MTPTQQKWLKELADETEPGGDSTVAVPSLVGVKLIEGGLAERVVDDKGKPVGGARGHMGLRVTAKGVKTAAR